MDVQGPGLAVEYPSEGLWGLTSYEGRESPHEDSEVQNLCGMDWPLNIPVRV